MNCSCQARSLQPVITSGVPDTEGMVRAKHRAYSRKARLPAMKEAMQASSKRANELSAFSEYVVFKEHLDEDERQMRAERVVEMSQESLRDVIANIYGVIGNVVIALVIIAGYNEVNRADDRPWAMLQGLVKKNPDKKVTSIELEDRLHHKIEKATPSSRQVKKMTKAMLQVQVFTSSGTMVIKK